MVCPVPSRPVSPPPNPLVLPPPPSGKRSERRKKKVFVYFSLSIVMLIIRNWRRCILVCVESEVRPPHQRAHTHTHTHTNEDTPA